MDQQYFQYTGVHYTEILLYILEAGRSLNSGITKLKPNAITGKIFKSKIAEHCWDEDQKIQWNKAEIIYKGKKQDH
jgi:hypothetical protein